MKDRQIASEQRLRDSLYDLYEQGGLDLYLAGTRSLKRELIIDLKTSALTPEKSEINAFCPLLSK